MNAQDKAGDHVRRVRHPHVARIAGELAQAVHPPNRAAFDLSDDFSVGGDSSLFDPPVVITNYEYRFRVAEQLREIGAEATILLEPDRRDSAAAAWAAAR